MDVEITQEPSGCPELIIHAVKGAGAGSACVTPNPYPAPNGPRNLGFNNVLKKAYRRAINGRLIPHEIMIGLFAWLEGANFPDMPCETVIFSASPGPSGA